VMGMHLWVLASSSHKWWMVHLSNPLKKILKQAPEHLAASPIRHHDNLVTIRCVKISRSRLIRRAVKKKETDKYKRVQWQDISYFFFFTPNIFSHPLALFFILPIVHIFYLIKCF
jgi:hypothetical protein